MQRSIVTFIIVPNLPLIAFWLVRFILKDSKYCTMVASNFGSNTNLRDNTVIVCINMINTG